MPAFKHSCFVDSWQSALKAMTWRTADVGVSIMSLSSQATSLLGSRISYPRSTSSARIRLAASTPSHTGISEKPSELGTKNFRESSIVRWSNMAAWKYPGPGFSQAAMASSPFVVDSTRSFARSNCAFSSLRAIRLSKQEAVRIEPAYRMKFYRAFTFRNQDLHPCNIPFVIGVLNGFYLHDILRYRYGHLG